MQMITSMMELTLHHDLLSLQQWRSTIPCGAGFCRTLSNGFSPQAHARTEGIAQEWVRMMLGCVGRGGNAQAVRDEILNIMHRNHIPEKNGTWMEQWHQKLVRPSTRSAHLHADERPGVEFSNVCASHTLWQRIHCSSPSLTVSLTFLQHNNTTPDDIGICEAYLAFLRAGGDNGTYWRVLDSHGQLICPDFCICTVICGSYPVTQVAQASSGGKEPTYAT
jgi:hypothetical protein